MTWNVLARCRCADAPDESPSVVDSLDVSIVGKINGLTGGTSNKNHKGGYTDHAPPAAHSILA